jgi:hypothetical protein
MKLVGKSVVYQANALKLKEHTFQSGILPLITKIEAGAHENAAPR